MGIPYHYSLELPRRCLILIDELWGEASKVYFPGEQYLGPLTMTFLLSMAAPIISLPIERIVKKFEADEHSYVDDHLLDPETTSKMKEVYEKGKLGDLPFFLSR